mmetsp:Transcript_69061/g.174063  ORF Transcript_69061/g.174063 Transcript_69061/m.174063 type:complete len:598 (-) Transcript_69061:150-1943(-)
MGEQDLQRGKPSRCACGFYLLGCIGGALVSVGLVEGNTYFVLSGIIFYCVYLIEAVCISEVLSYLANVLNEREFSDYIKHVQAAEPCMHFGITCYHYEAYQQTMHVNGVDVTKTKTRRVNSHSSTMRYPVQCQVDETLSPEQTLAMFHLLHDGQQHIDSEKGAANLKGRKMKTMILMCRFPLEFHPANEKTKQHYTSTRDSFWERNTRDQHQEKSEKNYLGGHREYVMAILKGGTDHSTDRPWWMHRLPYFLATICLMSLPYRFLLVSKCRSIDWTILKHFSHEPLQDDQEPPMHSRKYGTDEVSRAFRAIPRETLGATGLGCSSRQDDIVQLQVSGEMPRYWKNQDLATGFKDKIELSMAGVDKFQRLVDQTFKAKATRDLQDEPVPTKLVVKQVFRMEDANFWSRYTAKRSSLASLGVPTSVQDLPGSGILKTAQFMDLSGSGEAAFPSSVDDFAPEVNEAYLFHGSTPSGALGIGEHGFNLGMAGSNGGTTFGDSAYFTESSSKSDERASADLQGNFAGKQAFVLCRVLLGNPFYITSSDIPKIEQALATGSYNCVLGDCEAVADACREFVVFEESQIYPEYVLIYEREFSVLS